MKLSFQFPRYKPIKTPKDNAADSQFRTQLASLQKRIDRAYRRQTPEEILRETKDWICKQGSLVRRAVLTRNLSSAQKKGEKKT